MIPTQSIPAIAPAGQSARTSSCSLPLYAVLAVIAFSAFWVLLGSILIPGARYHDFLNLYTGASLARDGVFESMHSPEVQLQREREYAPKLPEVIPFVRPPFYALLLTPMAWLPFGPAFWVWLVVQSAALISTWIWAFRRWGADALILGSMYLPTALGIAHGQDCVLIAAIVLGVYALARRDQHFLSGMVLGLGLIKFHLFLLWPLALLIQKRWRMMAGACVAVAVELLVSLALAGPGGMGRYFALLQMTDLRRLSPSPELMINVRGLALNLGIDNAAVTGVLTAGVVALTAAACWRAPLWRCVAAASAGSLLAVPHVYGYDAGLLLIPLLLVVFESGLRWPRIAATALLTPLPMLLGLAGAPWPAATPLALLVLLASLAFMIPWRWSSQQPILQEGTL